MDESKRQVRIPLGATYRSLRVRRTEDGGFTFEWQVLAELLAFNGLDPVEHLEDPLLGALNALHIVAVWYDLHLRKGGSPDPVGEEIKEKYLQGANGTIARTLH